MQAEQAAAQGGGGAHGQIQLVPRAEHPEAVGQRGGDRVPAALVARGAGIGVDTVVQRPVQHGPDGVVHLGRGRHAGVAQGKVQYVPRAHDLGPALSMLEDLPHDVAVHPQLYHMFRNHTLSSLASLSPQALLRFKADKRIVARISPVDNPFGKT